MAGIDGIDGTVVDNSGTYASVVNSFGQAGQNGDALAAQFQVALAAAQQPGNNTNNANNPDGGQEKSPGLAATATAQAQPIPQTNTPVPNNGFNPNTNYPFRNIPANDNNKATSVWENAKEWAGKGLQFVGRNGQGAGVIGAELTAGAAAVAQTNHQALWTRYGGTPTEQVPTAIDGPWYASPQNAATVPSQYEVQIPGGNNLRGQMTYPNGDFNNSKLTVYNGANQPVATYDVRWGQNDYLWMGRISDDKGNVAGYTDPISVYPGGRAMTATNLNAAELEKLNAQANGGPDKLPTLDGPEKAPTQPDGHGFITHNAEEQNLVASMQAQGRSQNEIQSALEDLRAGKSTGADNKVADINENEGSGNKMPIPDAKRLRKAEQVTAGRLMALHPELTLKESPHEGAEYVDQNGHSYDAMGTSEASKNWNEGKFLKSIDKHLNKSNDYTVLDLTDFTADQKAAVKKYVDALPKEAQAKLIRIGF